MSWRQYFGRMLRFVAAVVGTSFALGDMEPVVWAGFLGACLVTYAYGGWRLHQRHKHEGG